MAVWKKVMIYKKYSTRPSVNIGEKINLETLTDKKWKDPKVFYTVSELIYNGNGIKWRADIRYIIEYPYITFYNKYAEYPVTGCVDMIIYEKGDKYYDE